jgi:hypothetical protein
MVREPAADSRAGIHAAMCGTDPATYTRERPGMSAFALDRGAPVVVDAAGVIRWHHFAPPEVNPGADGIHTALEALKEGRNVAGQPGEASADRPKVPERCVAMTQRTATPRSTFTPPTIRSSDRSSPRRTGGGVTSTRLSSERFTTSKSSGNEQISRPVKWRRSSLPRLAKCRGGD